MKANETIAKYGDLDELVKTVSKIAKDHNLRIGVAVSENGDSLNVSFEVPDEAWEFDFPTAREKVNIHLIDRSLQLCYDKCGDGDEGKIMTYCVRGF